MIVSRPSAVIAAALFAGLLLAAPVKPAAAAAATTTATTATTATADITVCFAPARPGACDPLALILREIGHARTSIHVFAYFMTSRPIANALIRAARRGVQVEILFDQNALSGQYPQIPDSLRAAGIPIKTDPAIPALMHDKIMVIDGAAVLTGSYNWTYAAEERDAENEILLRSPVLAAQYEAEFQFLSHGGW